MSSADDLQAHARIRDAALRLFGEQGIKGTTVRQMAEAAGVSAALVIHHFGSKDGLRRACDEWMMARLTETKTAAVSGADPLEAVFRAQNEFRPFFGYIAASITEGGDGADRLFEAMCGLTREMFTVGVPAGIMREPTDLDATVTLLVALSLGATVLEAQVSRRLGGTHLLDPAVLPRYSLASMELFTHGLFTDDTLLAQLRSAYSATGPERHPGDGVTDPDPPARPGPEPVPTPPGI